MSKLINSKKLMSVGLLSSLFTGGLIVQPTSIDKANATNASSENKIFIALTNTLRNTIASESILSIDSKSVDRFAATFDNFSETTERTIVEGISNAFSDDPPVAQPDEAVALIGQPVTIPILDNDFVGNTDTLSIDLDSVEGGTAEIVNKEVVFTPGSELGTYTISYTITDENDQTASADVTVEVFEYAD